MRFCSPPNNTLVEHAIPTAHHEGNVMEVLSHLEVLHFLFNSFVKGSNSFFEVSNCKIESDDFVPFLERCPHLEKLNISDSPSLFPVLVNATKVGGDEEKNDGRKQWTQSLKEIVFQQSVVFTPGTIRPEIFGNFPNLNSLDLSFWHDATDEIVKVSFESSESFVTFL
jgi:hypothetical protein